MTTVRQTKGIPSVPDVPPKLDIEGVYRILEPLTRIINIRQGKFSPLDRWVTQQDLVDANITTVGAVESPVIVIPPTSQYDFELIGEVIGGPVAMASGQPLIQMAATINLPFISAINGGAPASTYPGIPTNPYYGVLGIAPDAVQITTTIIDVSTFDQVPIDIATDGQGNWVVVCALNNIYYSDDAINWTKATTVPASSTFLNSVASNRSGIWVALGIGRDTIFTSDDNGDTWVEIFDDPNFNANGVTNVLWSRSADTFFTNGQQQSWQSADGTLPWTQEANGVTVFPQAFIIKAANTWISGHSGASQPRNGFAVDAKTFTMNNDFPDGGSFNGAPWKDADYDGSVFAVVTDSLRYRYWTSPTFGTPWNSGSDLRYDDAKTDPITILEYVEGQGLWYIITDVGDVYTSLDPTSGSSGWTELTTGDLPGNIPFVVNIIPEDQGSDAWIFLNTDRDLVVNQFV
jgi:hypothetical protein